MIGIGRQVFDCFLEGNPKPQARPVAWPVCFNGKWQARMGEDKKAACVPWRKAVGTMAVLRYGYSCVPRTVPLSVELRFVFRRPKSHLRADGKSLRKGAAECAVSKDVGDLDNLAKAVLDELEGVVFENDSAVIEMLLTKRYAGPHERPGVRVTVREWIDPSPRPPQSEEDS